MTRAMTEEELERLAEDSVVTEDMNSYRKWSPEYRAHRKDLIKLIQREKEERDARFEAYLNQL